MDINEAKKIVVESIKGVIKKKSLITEDMELVGGDALLDSMKLVELCVNLEEIAEQNGFEFDWTSEDAMSKSRGMFRSVSALSEEFAKQSES